MANMHKHKPRILRGVDDGTWSELGDVAEAAGSNRAEIIRQLIAWYLGRPGAKRPTRTPEARSSTSGGRT